MSSEQQVSEGGFILASRTSSKNMKIQQEYIIKTGKKGESVKFRNFQEEGVEILNSY